MLISDLTRISTSRDDFDYDLMLHYVAGHFEQITTSHGALFTVTTDGLWEAYLQSFPNHLRQTYNCRTCQKFIKTYGGLVVIDSKGRSRSALWNPMIEKKGYEPVRAPSPFDAVFATLAAIVETRAVIGQFFTTDKVWGDPGDDQWSHLSITPPERFVMRPDPLTTPYQAYAASIEDFKTVSRALTNLNTSVLDEALRMVKADALARSAQYVGPLQWLRDLFDRPLGRQGENALWLALSSAPSGYKHPNSAATGSLMKDILSGLPFSSVQAKFNAKMDSLKYQRPQAAPSVGNVRRAEEVFHKLGLAPALSRRFARLDEVIAVWRMSPLKTALAENGLFSHLTVKETKAVEGIYSLPQRTMSWAKFARTILPTAKVIKAKVPARSSSFTALLTATHADAPPLLRWDHEDRRNPVSWYFYHGSTSAAQWNLPANEFVPVTAICNAPSDWHAETPQRDAAILILQGAVDTRDAGLALFPETLREELREVRSTIEAYSKTGKITGRAEASACGIAITDKRNSSQPIVLLVDGELIAIDRFE